MWPGAGVRSFKNEEQTMEMGEILGSFLKKPNFFY